MTVAVKKRRAIMKSIKTRSVLFLILILSVVLITGCGSDSDTAATPAPNPDTVAPTVTLTAPLNNAVGVAINTKITATFTEAMDPITISTTTFTLKQGTTLVNGTVSYSGVTAVFTPAVYLSVSTVYNATITTGAKDLAGNALAVNKTLSFTTGVAADTTAPTVTLTAPINNATGVAINTKVSATFSEAIHPLTINTTTFTLKQGTAPVSGTVTYSGLTAVFTPSINLSSSTIYNATITTVAKDLAGNALAVNKVWKFTTGAAADTTKPTVTLTVPINNATGVAINTSITATFSEAMDPLTITTATFTVKQGTTTVAGAVTYSGLTAVFNPTGNLASSTIYNATVTTGVKDLAGNTLAVNKAWKFTTGAIVAAGPPPVDLGTAGDFVILAKSGVSTTGVTAVVGDIGLSPAAATFITGFGLIMDSTNTFSTSSLVTGKIYAADYTPPTPSKMTTAVGDMETAYTDAAGRVLSDYTELGAGNIDGMTLIPGLYNWSTDVSIPIGVTLSGGANDVWIFQIAGNLTVGNGAIVTLSGGAQAKNIYWQVAGQATLGTTSQFKGNILCSTSIALQTGAQMNGRTLAQTAVTLDATAITAP